MPDVTPADVLAVLDATPCDLSDIWRRLQLPQHGTLGAVAHLGAELHALVEHGLVSHLPWAGWSLAKPLAELPCAISRIYVLAVHSIHDRYEHRYHPVILGAVPCGAKLHERSRLTVGVIEEQYRCTDPACARFWQRGEIQCAP